MNARTGGRRISLAAAALAACATLGVLSTAGVAPASHDRPNRPNVIVVMTDDQRLDDLSVMPQTRRALQRGGVSFRNFYTTLPLCCPSRVTFLTGQYAHNHGIYSGRAPDGGYGAFKDNQDATMPVALQQAGYHTAHLGKYLNGYPQQVEGRPGDVAPGWDHWQALLGWRMFDFALNIDGTAKSFEGRRKYLTDVLARRASRLLHQSAEGNGPLFLSVMTLAPHREPSLKGDRSTPNPRPAPRHEGRFSRRGLPDSPAINERNVEDKPSFVSRRALRTDQQLETYKRLHRARLGSLLAVDDLVGRLVDTLRATGQLKDTYLIFTSDNGFLLGEHRLNGKNKLYEEALKVPALIAGPNIPEGVRLKQITGNVDLVPTIYDIANVNNPPIEPDGVSLLDVIEDPSAFAERDVVIEKVNGIGVRTPGWTYIEHDTNPDEKGPDEFELYDMGADPYQLQNLHRRTIPPGEPGHAPKRYDPKLELQRELLEARLDELRNCAGDQCRTP